MGSFRLLRSPLFDSIYYRKSNKFFEGFAARPGSPRTRWRPATNSTTEDSIQDYEVHEMHDAPDVMTETGGYPGESSHARGEEAPSSYIDDVVLMTEEDFTGTSSMSVGLCDSGSDSVVGDKGKVVYENIENIPPLPKTYIKSPPKPKRKHGDEDPFESSSAAKRIDFDDPSVA
ncbi:hypothetical protein SUGI_1085280 [Cryptomeria japonica]|nr:hypothetical protein SUGI_1085280 [Cryptomeria japonica]